MVTSRAPNKKTWLDTTYGLKESIINVDCKLEGSLGKCCEENLDVSH